MDQIVRFSDQTQPGGGGLRFISFASANEVAPRAAGDPGWAFADGQRNYFDLDSFAGGLLLITSSGGVGVTRTLSFWVAGRPGEVAYQICRTGSDTLLTLVVQQGRAYPIPDELFSAKRVVVTPQAGTECNAQLILKS